ncbi:MAG: tetratricopeptide repeat protein [Candidatus Latescibacteria bacterium]|nr:tetratricopeptide repeat protein [Candidatus Latescibacterota bacterium]
MTKKLSIGSLFFLLTVFIVLLFAQTLPLDARLRGGRIHFQGGRYEKALEQFESALADFPASTEARFWKAMSLEKMGKYIEAAAHFDTAYTEDAEWIEKTQKDRMYQYSAWNAMVRAGQTLDQDGNYADAITYLKWSTQVFPTSPQGYLLLSQIYSSLDSLEKIREIAMSLYEIDSTNQQVNILLGMFFFRKEDWDSSLMYYDKSIAAFAEDWELASATVGNELKLTAEQVPSAVHKLLEKREAKQLESYVSDSLKAKGKLTTITRLTDQLYTDKVELNILNFRAGVSALQKANSFKAESLQQKYLKSASDYFYEALRFNERDFDSKYNLGLVYYRSGADLKAESTFTALIDMSLLPIAVLSEALSDELMSLITVDNLNGSYFEIITPVIVMIEQETAGKDMFTTGYWYLYYHNFRKSKTLPSPEDKVKIYLSGLGIESIENLYLLLGATQTNLKKYDDAIASFNNVLLLNPKNQDAYRNLAVCYREKGDQKKAYEVLQEGEKMKKQP